MPRLLGTEKPAGGFENIQKILRFMSLCLRVHKFKFIQWKKTNDSFKFDFSLVSISLSLISASYRPVHKFSLIQQTKTSSKNLELCVNKTKARI